MVVEVIWKLSIVFFKTKIYFVQQRQDGKCHVCVMNVSVSDNIYTSSSLLLSASAKLILVGQ